MPDMVSQLVFLLKSALDTRIEVQVGFGGRKSQKALFHTQKCMQNTSLEQTGGPDQWKIIYRTMQNLVGQRT